MLPTPNGQKVVSPTRQRDAAAVEESPLRYTKHCVSEKVSKPIIHAVLGLPTHTAANTEANTTTNTATNTTTTLARAYHTNTASFTFTRKPEWRTSGCPP